MGSAYDPAINNLSTARVNETTGDVTLVVADRNAIFVSTDSAPVNMFLPSGLPAGFRVRSYQGGTGQVSYVAINGASIIDGQLRSLGQYSDGYFVDIENLGGDTWIVLGNTTDGVLEWSIIGQQSVREGDTATYVIWRPDSTAAFPEGVTLTIEGTDVDAAGLDQTLIEAIDNLCLLDSGVSFDGVDQLTILPSARNPLPLQFFAVPTYTAVGDRSYTITISNPSDGDVNVTHTAVTTEVLNTSRPIAPSELFLSHNLTTSLAATSGDNMLTCSSVAGAQVYSTVTHANIPALTWITDINGTTLTLSANITGDIAIGQTLAVKDPGFHLDFSDSTGMTLDGSNKCELVAERIHGYTFAQSSGANKPTFVASSLNSLGGLNFDGSKRMESTADAICKIADEARARSTFIMVSKLNSISATGYYVDGAIGMQAHLTTSAFSQVQANGMYEVKSSDNLGIPYIWSYKNDGTVDAGEFKCNGQKAFIPANVVGTAASGQKVVTLDDTSGIYTSMYVITMPYGGLKATAASTVGTPASSGYTVASVDSATQITLNTNLTNDLLDGQPIYFSTLIPINRPVSTAKTTANYVLGASKAYSSSINAVLYEIIHIPRILSLQEWRGVNLYLSNKWSTSTTTTTTASAAEGDTSVIVDDTTDLRIYQTVSGTNIKDGTTVIKINTSTKEVWFDEAIQSGGVANGATLTFHYCSFKKPDLIDVGAMVPTFRDDFVEGARLAASGSGWRPYYGDPSNPNTFASAYGAAGHGSSNNGTAEKQWYLDVVNWSPWREHTPFSQFKDSDVPKGGLKITASPAGDDIIDLIGYNPPDPKYTHISGYLRDAGSFNQQYGYWESRIKTERTFGVWAAFWLTAANGAWPPEVDICELYGKYCAATQQVLHCNRTFNKDFAARSASTYGSMMHDFSEEYALFGVHITPTSIVFYINRERVDNLTFTPQWDFHTHWYPQINLAVQAVQSPDLVTSMASWFDYVAVWKDVDQSPTITGDTQAETTALVAAMTSTPDSTRQGHINRVIERLKLYDDGFGNTLWSAIDGLVVGWAHDAQAARIDWKDPTIIGSVVGTPTFTTDLGYSGTLNSSYIDMGVTLSTEAGYHLNSALNQCSIGCYASSITGTTARAVGTSKFYVNPRTGNSGNTSLWSASSRTFAMSATGGHIAAVRNHFQYTFYENGGLANGALGTGKPTTGDNVRSTDTETLKIANGTARVGYAFWGDYLTPDSIRYITDIMTEYGEAVGAL